MRDIMTAPFMTEMIRTTANMYAHGWDERNGGNISLLLEEETIREYLDVENVLRVLPTGFSAPALEGRYFSSPARGSISKTSSTIRRKTWA